MDFSSSNTDWIWAVKDGSSISSDSVSASLQQHSQYGNFNFDLTKARGGNSLNPFCRHCSHCYGSRRQQPDVWLVGRRSRAKWE